MTDHLYLFICVLLLTYASSSSSINAAVDQRKCRLVAIGDLHGDLEQTKKVLHEVAQLTDSSGLTWKGGCATLVQTGDIVDRGDESLAVLDLFARLRFAAKKHGGTVINILGNHEHMVLASDFRYVAEKEMESKGGLEAFRNLFGRGGVYGKQLRGRRKIVHFDQLSKTVFVHGGLTPEFLQEFIHDMNSSTTSLGLKSVVDHINQVGKLQLQQNNIVAGDHFKVSPALWDREIVGASAAGQCDRVSASLALLGAARMVVGHTPQQSGRIGSFCGSKMVDIDIGLSKAMMGNLGCLEIDRETGHAFALYPGERIKLA